MLLCAVAASGCGKKKNSNSPAGAKAGQPVVTSDKLVAGRVGKVNQVGRFVVLNFPTGKMPDKGQSLNVYRKDVKIAEVKVVGPQRGENVVADIVSGEPEEGDEARQN